MSPMSLHQHGAACRQGRSVASAAAGHGKSQWEIAGTEHDDRVRAEEACGADRGKRLRPPVRRRAGSMRASTHEPLAQHLGKKAELAAGAGAFALQPRQGQPGF